MRKILFCLGIVFCVSVSEGQVEKTNSGSAGPFILSVHLGPAVQQDITVKRGFLFDPSRNGKISFLTGGRFDIGLAYQIADSLAVGIESGLVVTYPRTNEDGDFGFYQVPFMANVIYTIPVRWPIKPFLGIGLGGILTYVEQNRFLGPTFADREFTPAGQAFAGLRYEFNDQFDISLEYRFVAGGEMNFDVQHATTSGTRTHSISAAFGFRF